MAENQRDTTPVTVESSANGTSFIKRELNGSSFLTLEHVGHMLLTVVIAGLLASGINVAISMWTGGVGDNPLLHILEPMAALSITTALIVLVPLLVVLDRRTRAEWRVRAGYTDRLAYKVPVYTALGLLIAAKTLAFIQAMTIVVTSLTLIGVKDASVGTMYLTDFLPAIIATAIFGGAAWYVFKLAKGRDNGRMFSLVMAVLGVAMAVTLFITIVVQNHNSKAEPVSNPPSGGSMVPLDGGGSNSGNGGSGVNYFDGNGSPLNY
ncbi:MAG TPA: hypothetical protein VLG40_05420 [Candidatus Saccharimonas sp.]|nr:hypothetical protein [Candidatus Saccharimonas sp.]